MIYQKNLIFANSQQLGLPGSCGPWQSWSISLVLVCLLYVQSCLSCSHWSKKSIRSKNVSHSSFLCQDCLVTSFLNFNWVGLWLPCQQPVLIRGGLTRNSTSRLVIVTNSLLKMFPDLQDWMSGYIDDACNVLRRFRLYVFDNVHFCLRWYPRQGEKSSVKGQTNNILRSHLANRAMQPQFI
jgi:hypothetical protein